MPASYSGDLRALQQCAERHTSRKMLDNKQDQMKANMPWFRVFEILFHLFQPKMARLWNTRSFFRIFFVACSRILFVTFD